MNETLYSIYKTCCNFSETIQIGNQFWLLQCTRSMTKSNLLLLLLVYDQFPPSQAIPHRLSSSSSSYNLAFARASKLNYKALYNNISLRTRKTQLATIAQAFAEASSSRSTVSTRPNCSRILFSFSLF